MAVDLLAIAAHRDDVELTCAGTLLKARDMGHRTGILDLTAGESGTRGSADLRADEASAPPRFWGSAERRNAGLPDAHLQNTEETRRVVVEHDSPLRAPNGHPALPRRPSSRPYRSLRAWPRCLLPCRDWRSTRPAAQPHRPHKILYALAYREDPVKPTFVVDISDQFERKLRRSAATRASSTAPRPQARSFRPAGSVFPGRDPERALRIADPHPVRRAVLHRGNRPGRRRRRARCSEHVARA